MKRKILTFILPAVVIFPLTACFALDETSEFQDESSDYLMNEGKERKKFPSFFYFLKIF